ncbi:class I SAM-dependent methyltransferase [Francisella philomiragia]|uniref:class I SAM-dependent methyltransferase n=1 Tax=Francisella philomiragia TaxID=28110 RepID=UPI001907009F|nr:class I SAM-dependent methyltransferase [Francisella philomiragia]MBK2296179.1 methyltransferase domain-containing protein [Francisella philomiragia]MBK2339938.1 methyltransferase domain-containing protein [Francisella philomiragia]
MTEFDLLIELHKNNPRQGPGSEADTLKALSFIQDKLPKHAKVLDIGCGTGGQTLTLANNLDCEIVAVDLFEDFLTELNLKVQQLGLQEKISTLSCSMDNLDFNNQQFDLIWSEGAIYVIGFKEGIQQWKKFLKPNGYMAISEITWTTNQRPDELNNHWQEQYPQISTAAEKIKIIQESGFSLVGYFLLPQQSWEEGYYKAIENNLGSFIEKFANNGLAKEIVKQEKQEIDIYRKYKDYYSYGFYLFKNT